MTIYLHKNDLPADLQLGNTIAVDTETLGLNLHRDRLCLVQISSGDGDAHLVQIAPYQDKVSAPNLTKLLADPNVLKLYHFARFDLASLYQATGVMAAPVFCTKVASKLTRTYTDKHGLKDLCKELLNIELNKESQSSDWGAKALSEEQQAYAASDVLHLHALKDALENRLDRENRQHLAQACFDFLPSRALLDLAGWDGRDILAHH